MKQIVILLCIMVLIGCKPDDKFEYDIIISESAINLGNLNSEYDDYNSDLPYPAQRMDIFFSSNRNSKGVEFDIVSGKLDFHIIQRTIFLMLVFQMICLRASRDYFPKDKLR